MNGLIYGEDEKVKNWIISKIEYVHKLDPCAAIGVGSKDRLIAGVAYHDYQKQCAVIQISMAAISPMWAKRVLIHELLRYPFEQLDCFKIMISVKLDNIKALNTFSSIGFRQEAVLGHSYGKGQHAVIMRMLKPDYNRMFGKDNG